MQFSLRLVFFVFLATFLLSALIGALISYNPALAWSRFAAITAGVGLCVLFAETPEHLRVRSQNTFPLMSAVLALLPTALFVYFVATNDWTNRLGKVTWLDPLMSWFATWQPKLPGLWIDTNSLGGALAMLIPLQVVAVWRARALMRIMARFLVFVSLFGLVLSASRGAWVAFGLVAWIAAMWLVLERVMPGWRSGQMQIVIWVALVAYLALTIGIAIAFTPLGAWMLSEGGGHWLIARNSFDLVTDYPFTGIGLGTFTMAYSSYILLVHVPHTIHAHNLLLDIWLEQGLLGLLAFAGLIGIAVFNRSDSRWRFAGLASLGVMLIHGLLDDAFYGYGAGTLALMLIPLGILVRESSMRMIPAPRRLAPVLAGALALLIALIVLVPTMRATIEANLGALAQTRAELSVYEWPRYSFQDQLRRNGIVDLKPAVAHYQNALALDPTNATANRRLGQIELSLGHYDAAHRYLDAAYASTPQHVATRILLGELYALDNQSNQAIALWQNLEMKFNSLQTRLWWYEFIGDQDRLQKLRQATQKAKN